jgi:hypothetical protein
MTKRSFDKYHSVCFSSENADKRIACRCLLLFSGIHNIDWSSRVCNKTCVKRKLPGFIACLSKQLSLRVYKLPSTNLRTSLLNHFPYSSFTKRSYDQHHGVCCSSKNAFVSCHVCVFSPSQKCPSEDPMTDTGCLEFATKSVSKETAQLPSHACLSSSACVYINHYSRT